MENLNTDDLMKLQVEQLEKEKKDLNQRLRIVAKRVDHIERAYRKEERPLLGQDYEEQQANDRLTFEAVQKARIEGSKISHQRDIETKKRLSRMMDDYKSRRDVIAGKRGDDYARRQAIAARKIEEERAKRRKAVLQEREEERLRIETEERARREKEEEEARLEAGMYIRG
jgi:translation initiation factor 3 subunit A